MVNQELADIFEQIADLMEIQGEDIFRVNTYRRAARVIGDLTEDIAVLAGEDRLQRIPGVGKGTADRIRQFLKEGKIDIHQELLRQLPAGLLDLRRVPGLGPKKISTLYRELGVDGLPALSMAIEAGKLANLAGFGPKSIENLKEGIAFLGASAGRVPLGLARPLAEGLRGQLTGLPGVRRVEIAGSARRGCETVGDLDLLCDADDGAAVIERFCTLEQTAGVRARGETKGSILVPLPGGQIQVDLRVVPGESFGAAWQYFTGSKEHNVRLRERAAARGWKLNEYGLFDGERMLAGASEEEIYGTLGLPCLAPELREDRGEFDAADALPALVSIADIRGDLHTHTTASDGRSSLFDMASAAQARGYSYLGVTDHSRSSVIANGLSLDRLERHVADIRTTCKKFKGFTLLAGIECDILADGTLDYPDEVLAGLDWVVASIHAAQSQSRAKITARTLAAIENPYVNAIGHPSGRLIGKRDAMDLDWAEVFKAAARTGTAIEVSASWQRLDLKDLHVRQAIDAGCTLVINTDAHSTDGFDEIHFGVTTARRGWAAPANILNTGTLADVRAFVQRKRS